MGMALFLYTVFFVIFQNKYRLPHLIDPIKTRQGTLTIRAYRLIRKALDLASSNGEWTPEQTKQAGLNFTTFFEELPVVVKNSHLMNVLVAELALSSKCKRPTAHLELGTKRSLERFVNKHNLILRSDLSMNVFLCKGL